MKKNYIILVLASRLYQPLGLPTTRGVPISTGYASCIGDGWWDRECAGVLDRGEEGMRGEGFPLACKGSPIDILVLSYPYMFTF
jgi:hypothetical protein